MNSTSSNTSTVHKVGFISPPAWFDISPVEFLRITPEKTITLQTVIRPHYFGYKEEDFIKSVGELKICYDSLSAAGADVVVQFGYPFSLFHGWEKASQIQQEIENRGNAHFIMMGVGVVDALKHLGCESVAIASTYYSEAMSKILIDFIIGAGLYVLGSENWQSMEMAGGNDAGLFIGEDALDPMSWETPVEAVKNAVRNVFQQVPEADGILVTGGGMRVLDIADSLEQEINKPVIGGDVSLYWGILTRLNIGKKLSKYGRLLSSIGYSIS